VSKVIDKVIGSLLVIWVMLMLLGDTLVPQVYEPQVDQRKREYYPATVVDKGNYESCSKTKCTGYYTVVVELDEGLGYSSITTTKEGYDSAYVGGKISFERNKTDPKVIRADRLRSIYFSFACIIFIISFCIVLWKL
jgi:hypothetical protein